MDSLFHQIQQVPTSTYYSMKNKSKQPVIICSNTDTRFFCSEIDRRVKSSKSNFTTISIHCNQNISKGKQTASLSPCTDRSIGFKTVLEPRRTCGKVKYLAEVLNKKLRASVIENKFQNSNYHFDLELSNKKGFKGSKISNYKKQNKFMNKSHDQCCLNTISEYYRVARVETMDTMQNSQEDRKQVQRSAVYQKKKFVNRENLRTKTLNRAQVNIGVCRKKYKNMKKTFFQDSVGDGKPSTLVVSAQKHSLEEQGLQQQFIQSVEEVKKSFNRRRKFVLNDQN